MKFPNDLTGLKFGRLTVICKAGIQNQGKRGSRSMWLCKCDCGNEKVVIRNSLVTGNTQSCGCLEHETKVSTHLKHGMAKSRLWNIWCGIKDRCNNPNKKDWQNCYPEYQGNDTDIKDIYDQIHLPKRATTGSAGCDFFSPSNLTIYPNGAQIISDNPFKIFTGEIKIPTGIRCWIEDGWVLQIYPRSSLGFKYGIHLANTVGIIDSDYYNSDNEGHIFVKIVNDSSIRDAVKIETGQLFQFPIPVLSISSGSYLPIPIFRTPYSSLLPLRRGTIVRLR